jgi:hypothetical protein
MKAIIIATCFIGCLTIVNAQLLTAAAIVIGAKILIAKGFVYGAAKGALARNIASGGRGKRQSESGDFNNVLIEQGPILLNSFSVADITKLECAAATFLPEPNVCRLSRSLSK